MSAAWQKFLLDLERAPANEQAKGLARVSVLVADRMLDGRHRRVALQASLACLSVSENGLQQLDSLERYRRRLAALTARDVPRLDEASVRSVRICAALVGELGEPTARSRRRSANDERRARVSAAYEALARALGDVTGVENDDLVIALVAVT